VRDQDATNYQGVLLMNVARTLVDLGRHQSTAMTIAAADFALHNHLVTAEELEEVQRFCWNWPGIGRATRALALADARSESPLESLSRLVIPNLGLPAPTPQARIGDERGRFVARVDFGWDWLGVVGEADGLGKYDDANRARGSSALAAEKLRQERLEALGLVVVRWGWSDVTQEPGRLRARVLDAFHRAERLRQAGLLPKWSVLRP